jgi:murein DD-endopeptidase MepM/ murein hydrolase activator NlpD
LTTAAAWSSLPLPRDASSGRAFVVTSAYGSRDGAHRGIDLATRDASGTPTTGLPVFAVASGVVVRTPDDERGGQMVVLELFDDSEVKYAHLSVRGVRVGDVVQSGAQLGLSGDSGIVRGPHLHLEHWHAGASGPMDPRVHLDALTALDASTDAGSGALVVGGIGLLGFLWLLGRRKR